MILQVSANAADIAIPGVQCSLARMSAATCSLPVGYSPYYLVQRVSRRLPPITNIVRTYSPTCWLFIFLSITLVSLYLLAAGILGISYNGDSTNYLDQVLLPLRYQPIVSNSSWLTI